METLDAQCEPAMLNQFLIGEQLLPAMYVFLVFKINENCFSHYIVHSNNDLTHQHNNSATKISSQIPGKFN